MASLSALEKKLSDTKDGPVSLIVAVQGSRVTERGCKQSGVELDQAVQIVRNSSGGGYALLGLVDADGNFDVEFDVPNLKSAVQSAADALRKKFEDLPREEHKYGVYFRGAVCSKPAFVERASSLSKQSDVGTLLGKKKPTEPAPQKSFFDTKPDIGKQLRELYALHSADADNKLLVTLRANLPTTGAPTCEFDESLSTVQVVAGKQSSAGESADDLARALLAAAKKVSANAGGADPDDMVVLFKPAQRCKFTALENAELDYAEPLTRILTSDESLAKNKIRLTTNTDPSKFKNVDGDNALAKQNENERKRQEMESGSGGDENSGANANKNAKNVQKPPAAADDSESSGLSTVAIFSIVGGVLLAIVLLLVFLNWREHNARKRSAIGRGYQPMAAPNSPLPPPPPPPMARPGPPIVPRGVQNAPIPAPIANVGQMSRRRQPQRQAVPWAGQLF